MKPAAIVIAALGLITLFFGRLAGDDDPTMFLGSFLMILAALLYYLPRETSGE